MSLHCIFTWSGKVWGGGVGFQFFEKQSYIQSRWLTAPAKSHEFGV